MKNFPLFSGKMVDRAGIVVSSLAKLEGGWSQLVAKYFR